VARIALGQVVCALVFAEMASRLPVKSVMTATFETKMAVLNLVKSSQGGIAWQTANASLCVVTVSSLAKSLAMTVIKSTVTVVLTTVSSSTVTSALLQIAVHQRANCKRVDWAPTAKCVLLFARLPCAARTHPARSLGSRLTAPTGFSMATVHGLAKTTCLRRRLNSFAHPRGTVTAFATLSTIARNASSIWVTAAKAHASAALRGLVRG